MVISPQRSMCCTQQDAAGPVHVSSPRSKRNGAMEDDRNHRFSSTTLQVADKKTA